jgi:hypothetical protein
MTVNLYRESKWGQVKRRRGDGKIVTEAPGNRRMEGIDKDPDTAIKP